MRITTIFCLLFIALSFQISAQKKEYISLTVPDSLKENANAVIRFSQIDINILSQQSMTVKEKRVVTIWNQNGLNAINAITSYDKRKTVKSIEAIVYDAFGNEIKKIKRKDFKDQSASGGGTLFSDGRYLSIDYTPSQYPFTIVYECETETSNTAFIPTWFVITDYYVSVEKSILNIMFPSSLGFRKKEFNFENFKIIKEKETDTQLTYSVQNILAQKHEDYTPVSRIFPKVMMGLDHFNLEGVDGTAKNWNEYGKWFSENILKGTDVLNEDSKSKIKALVGSETDPIKKAKIVYKFVQEKSRYVSVQVGIGGFKPMFANDVDRLGYGDCKGLSNYTRALLQTVGVPSYYTELYGDDNIRDIEADFFSIQGNHAILCIPNGTENIFLECTSQTDPFGFQANFTDDRDVVVMKPDGGQIIHTKKYQDKDNSQISKGNYSIDATGTLVGSLQINSAGSQYHQKVRLEILQPDEKDDHYKKYWSALNALKVEKLNFVNDKENVRFEEHVKLNVANYGSKVADKIIFAVNAFNLSSANVKRIRNRKNPFEIQRGFYDVDEIEIKLPAQFAVENMPADFEFNSKFGEYKTQITKKDEKTIVYKRAFWVKKGFYTNKEYDEYRLFMEQISRNDNAKIILTPN